MTRTRRVGWRFRRSPLRRPSYLVEAWLLLVTWTLAVVTAVVAGAVTAQGVERDMNRLRAERHAVPALLTQDAQQPPAEGGDTDQAWATVHWTGADGTAHKGVARVEPGGRAGSPTRIWLDTEGHVVSEPATAAQAELNGAVLGAATALVAFAAVAFTGLSGCARLERRRLARWDEEWAEIGPQWGRMTG
ncbi:hypothetical protein [Streptomyces sp. NPDC046909]|uniref:Rv1733c family protein n=1 Tax=Streptomyces sp. NPDC046909 TaxID=3155617 RepID=UPI0033FFD2CD